jgi:EmrB/QacA subfamily drug resistance transporter
MENMDSTVIATSLPAIAADIGTSPLTLKLAITSYLLSLAVFIPASGWTADRFGPRMVFALAVGVFMVGSIGCALSSSVTNFVFARILQGMGGAMMTPVGRLVLLRTIDKSALVNAMTWVTVPALIGPVVGPPLGGFITTYLSWRIGFLMEDVIIAVILVNIRLVKDVPYTGTRRIDLVGAILSVVAMGGLVLGILVWQEGGESVAALIAFGAAAMAALAWWLVKRKREGKPALIDAGLFSEKLFRYGATGQMLQQIALGGMMISLPIYLQMVLEYNAMQAGLSLAPLSLSMFAVALVIAKRGPKRRPAAIIRIGFALVALGILVLIPFVPRVTSGWYLIPPLLIAGCGLGLLVSQLNNYTLSPIDEEHVSEAAGVNSAAGSFGLSFGLAFAGAILLASLSLFFTHQANSSTVLRPAQKEQVSKALEHDAEVMSNTQLEQQLSGQSDRVTAEIIRINTVARHRALQVALLIPLIAALIGLVVGFRMTRLPDPKPSEAAEGMVLG